MDGRKEGHMITKISRIYRLPFSVKISRLQSGRYFSQKLVLHGEKRQHDNFARSAWSYVKKSQSLQTFRLTNRARINLGKNTGSSAVNTISWSKYKQKEKTVSVVSRTNNKNDKPRLRFLPKYGLRTKQSGSLSRL